MQQTPWDRRDVLWGLSVMAGAGVLGAGAENACPRHCRKSPQHIAPVPTGLLHRLLLTALG